MTSTTSYFSHMAEGAYEAAFAQHGTALQGEHAADENRENARHEKAGVADFEKLLSDLAAMLPRARQSAQRAGQQGEDLPDRLKHTAASVRDGLGISSRAKRFFEDQRKR